MEVNATGVVYTPGVCSEGKLYALMRTFGGAKNTDRRGYSDSVRSQPMGCGRPQTVDGQKRIPRFLYMLFSERKNPLTFGYQSEF